MIVERCLALSPDERPRVLVCASAVGFYGDRGEEYLDESSVGGSGFLAEVCREWEEEAGRLAEVGVRVVRIRIGVVLSSEGGALAMMKTPFSLGVGGRLGPGDQFFPWIHLEDLAQTFMWALDSSVSGPVNAVAPEAIRNRDLTHELGRILGRPTIFPVPAFALRLALGELAGELLGSRRVKPAVLEAAGFDFEHETLASALEAELA